MEIKKDKIFEKQFEERLWQFWQQNKFTLLPTGIQIDPKTMEIFREIKRKIGIVDLVLEN